MAFTVHAAVIFEDTFGYPDGDVNGSNGWVATSNGATFNVVGGELLMAKENQGNRLMLSGPGNGTSIVPGDSIKITIDHRHRIPNDRKHARVMTFGVQTNGVTADGVAQSDTVSGFNHFWGQELTRQSGELRYTAEEASWWSQPATYGHSRKALEDCGFNPFGYDTNSMTDIATVDSDSDTIRIIYTLTKSHVTNQFDAAVTTSNLTSGISYTSSITGMERTGAWASSNYWFFVGSNPEVGVDFTNLIANVKMEKLPPALLPPTSVSALGLDGSISLSWTLMPGATTYDVYRSTTSGVFVDPPVSVSTESYTDPTVVNGTPYYYAVVANYYNGDSIKSGEATATPQAIYADQAVFFADFSPYALGDLAATADWNAISGSGNNAFDVIDDGGTKKADTASVEADFDSTVGNAVYLDRLISNEQDDQIDGYIDVVISSSATGGADSDHVNWSVMNFGLSGSTTEALGVTKSMMALFRVLVRFENNINLMFAATGNDSDANRLAYLSWSEAGWNPKPIFATGKPWIGDSEAPLDLVTDPIRISWSIRKTREAGVYQAWASMSNLTTSAVNDGTPTEIDFATYSATDLYDAPASLFVMGHDPESNDGVKLSTLHATVGEVSVTHESGVLPVVIAPVVTSVLEGDRQVSIGWDPVLDARSYTLTVETPGPEFYTVVSSENITSITDSPRWNDIANTYALTANFDGDLAPNTASTNFVAAPIGLVPAFAVDTFGTANMDTSLAQISNSVDWATIDAMTTPFFENGVNGYTGPNLYGMFKGKQAVDGVTLAAKVQSNGESVNFGLALGWKSWPYASVLAFIEASDMGTASFDATAETLNIEASWGASTTGNSGNTDNGVRMAIRNGSTWYASDENILATDGTAGQSKTIIVADVANADWRPITGINAASTSEMWIGAAVSGSTFTDVTAIGWFQTRGWSSSIYGLEVKVQGALPSYEYWAENSGLVSSNSAAGDDPDFDGLVNEKEYAFGGDPLAADTAMLPVMDLTIQPEPGTGNDTFTYVYMKQRDPEAGITYNLKETEYLQFGGWDPASYTATESVVDYYWSVVTNYVPVTADTTFLKLDIE
ncbi:hypothetical protein [Pontiella sulfatireligans]|nr:hypothetical protein [Pontiella sulfatireligans]